MESLKIEDYVNVRHFRIFVFNDKGHIMLIQQKGRLDIPFGNVSTKDEDIEAAVRRIIFAETKTAINPIAPVAILNAKDRNGNEVPTVILTARMDGEAQIKPDEKTHHRLVDEQRFSSCSGYSNKQVRELLEEAKHALFCEEVKIEREEETQYGREKYNFRSHL